MNRLPALLALSLVASACGAATGLRDGDGGRDAAPPPPDTRPSTTVGAWERCFVGDQCAGGTTCLPSIYSADAAPARICTRACSRTAACPTMGTHSTFPVGCATDQPATGVGQCFEVCETSRNCGPGTACVTRAGLAFQLCLPLGAAR